MDVAVIGATGQAGSAMVAVLEQRGFPLERLRVLASARSAGGTIEFRGERLVVEDASTADYRGLGIVLMAAGKGTALAHAIEHEAAVVLAHEL